MPIPIISQNPTPFWDFDVVFPVLKDTDVAPLAFNSGAFNREHWSTGLTATGTAGWSQLPGAHAAAGGATSAIQGGEQTFVRANASAGSPSYVRFPIGAFRAWPDTGTVSAPLAAGAEMESLTRGWWLTWLMRCSTVNPGPKNGVIIYPVNTRNAAIWPTQIVGAANTGGFGIVGDGAGQWQYASYDRTGVALLREAVALPAHTLTDWNSCEVFITNARPGIPATVEVYFNGTLIVNRGWASGLLEDYAANEWSYVPSFAGGDSMITEFKAIRCRKGGFTRLGAPLP